MSELNEHYLAGIPTITREDFNKGMAVLQASFQQSRIELSEYVLEIWFHALEDILKERFNYAVMQTVKQEKFFPVIATLREYASKPRMKSIVLNGEKLC